MVHKSQTKHRQKRTAGSFCRRSFSTRISSYALQAVADDMRRNNWMGAHLDSHVAQKLADRAFRLVQKVALGQARKVRFKGKGGIHSFEGKTNAACIRWREDRILWNGLELAMVKASLSDPVIQHGLSSRIKYIRLIRR
jgi:hypothetical protein